MTGVWTIDVKGMEFCAMRKTRDSFFAKLGRKSAGVLREREKNSLKKFL